MIFGRDRPTSKSGLISDESTPSSSVKVVLVSVREAECGVSASSRMESRDYLQSCHQRFSAVCTDRIGVEVQPLERLVVLHTTVDSDKAHTASNAHYACPPSQSLIAYLHSLRQRRSAHCIDLIVPEVQGPERAVVLEISAPNRTYHKQSNVSPLITLRPSQPRLSARTSNCLASLPSLYLTTKATASAFAPSAPI